MGWGFHKEGIVGISRRMTLWLEERVKVPEGTLYPFVCGHFHKPHLHEDTPEFSAYFEEGMIVASLDWGAHRFEVHTLEVEFTPVQSRLDLRSK